MSVYLNYVTGKLYTERMPGRIVELAPERKKSGKVIYVEKTHVEGDTGFQDALDRWLFLNRQVRKYEEMPDWAKEINHVEG